MRYRLRSELVEPGLLDLAAGRETEATLLVAAAAPRLARSGAEVPMRADADKARVERLLRELGEPR